MPEEDFKTWRVYFLAAATRRAEADHSRQVFVNIADKVRRRCGTRGVVEGEPGNGM